MKNLILALGFSCLAILTNVAVAGNVSINNRSEDWMKSKEGTWVGKDMHWYKLAAKDASVWWSKDGKNWEVVKDGMWQDKGGKWIKIADKKLMWSADEGKTWAEVPEWTWEGTDGTWNKFDKDWSLWTKHAHPHDEKK